MKRNFIWGFGLAIFMMLAIWGCEDNDNSITDGDAKLVQVWLESDLLGYLPGDTASCAGFATVTDMDLNPLPNVQIEITPSQPDGMIQYLDSANLDRTNDSGQVRFRYKIYGFSGSDAIYARIGNQIDVYPFRVVEAGNLLTAIDVFADHDTCRLAEGEMDSVLISARCYYDSANPVSAGVHVSFSATGGRIEPNASTDFTGTARALWRPSGEKGRFRIDASWNQIGSCIWIVVE